MRRVRFFPVLAALVLASGLVPAPGRAAHAAQFEQTVTFREPLGQAWTDELVHHDLRVPQGRVAAATFALLDAEGKPAPVQVDVLEGTAAAVRRARLWWKAAMPAGSEVAWRVTYNDEGRKAPRPPGGVAVRRGDGRLIVLAGTFEAMVPAPEKPFEKAVPLRKAPAPLLGVRAAGQRAWSGEFALDGAAYVREIRTAVEASGPVFAVVRLRYIGEAGGHSYEAALRIVHGEPWIDVSERYRLAAGCRLTAVLRGRRPPEVLWMPWQAGGGDGAEPAYDLRRLVLDAPLRPDVPFAAMRPRCTLVRDAAQALLALGPGDAGPAVGFVMTAPGDWQRPYENFPSARPWVAGAAAGAPSAAEKAAPAGAAPAAQKPAAAAEKPAIAEKSAAPPVQAVPEGVAVDFPLAEGRRRWLLVVGPRDQFDEKGDLHRLIRRAADLPLDKVLCDWVLSWPRGRVELGPHLLTTWDRLRPLREDLAGGRETPAAGLVARALAGEARGDRRLAELVAGRQEASAALNVAPIFEACYQAPELSPAAAWPRRLPRMLLEADLAAAGRSTAAGEPSTCVDASVAFLAYVFGDPNYRPGAAGGWEAGGRDPAGLGYAVPLYAAAMLPDHPHASRWSAAALAALRDDLRRTSGVAGQTPGKDAPEAVPDAPACLRDRAAAMLPLLERMLAAQNARLEDPFRWPEARAAVEFFLGLHAPADARLGRRGLPPFGDSLSRGRGASGEAGPAEDRAGLLFGLAAAGFRQHDAAFASQCMAMYRHYFGAAGGGDLAADLAAAQAGFDAQERSVPPLPAAGRAWPGFGAVLRSRPARLGDAAAGPAPDRGAFAAFRCGPPGRPAGPDEMAFHFFGAGQPLALAWRAEPAHRIYQEHMYNRISLGDDENMDAAAELAAFQASDAADLAVGQVRTGALRKLPRWPHEVPPAAAFPRRTLAAEARWRRMLCLVKHAGGPLEDYLVVRDELASAEPATFNLWLLARSVRQEGRLLLFDGQLAADAAVFVAAPDADRVRLDRWAWPRQDESAMIPRGFRAGVDRWRAGELQQGLHVEASAGEAFLVAIYPLHKGAEPPRFEPLAQGRGVRVSLAGASEEVYLASDPPADAGGQAALRREGRRTVILPAGTLPPLGKPAAE